MSGKEQGWSMTRVVIVVMGLIIVVGWCFLASEYAKEAEGWRPAGSDMVRGRVSLLIASIVAACHMGWKGILEIPNAFSVIRFSLSERLGSVIAIAVLLILVLLGGLGAKRLEDHLSTPYKRRR